MVMVTSSSSSSSSNLHNNNNNNNDSHTKIIHFNHAGASPPPSIVKERIIQHLDLEERVGGYTAKEMVEDELKDVYEKVATLIGARSSEEIALVESATVAWTKLFYSFVEYQLSRSNVANNNKKKKKIILMSELEYGANVVAACQWAKDHKDWKVLIIPSKRIPPNKKPSDNNNNNEDDVTISTGRVDTEILKQMLEGRYDYYDTKTQQRTRLDPATIAIVCITHIPTNSGIMNPIEEIGELIHDYNNNNNNNDPSILYLVDTCQTVGQVDQLEVATKIHCHGCIGTSRKFLRGPRGVGFLYLDCSASISDKIIPSHIDHVGFPIQHVPTTTQQIAGLHNSNIEDWIPYQPLPGAKRFEFYESNIANKLGFGKALEYHFQIQNELAASTSSSSIQTKCQTLFQYLRQKLRQMEGVYIYHDEVEVENCDYGSILTFWTDLIDSKELKEQLWSSSTKDNENSNDDDDDDDVMQIQFEVSTSPLTSTPIDSSNYAADSGVVPIHLVRVSMHYTNSKEDLDAFCQKLQFLLLQKQQQQQQQQQ